jgi:predicted ATPase
VQDTAYQSLLKRERQRLHQQIAHVFVDRFLDTAATQPEMLAHHYTEAGLIAQAIPYWRRAGKRATQRWAYVEAIRHFMKGLEVLKGLPDTPERAQQELTLQIALGGPLTAIKGFGAPEVEKVYGRALALCRQVGETPRLFEALFGLWVFYTNRPEYQTGRELGEQLLTLAQSVQNLALLPSAHAALGFTLFWLGEIALGRAHQEQGIALYNSQQHHSYFPGWPDSGVVCRSYAAQALWSLGYPDQALQRSQEALTLAHKLSHPFSLAMALYFAAVIHLARREWQAAQERAEVLMTLAAEQGFTQLLAYGTFHRGAALAEQGQGEEGMAQMQQGLAAFRAIGTEMGRTARLPWLAAAYAKVGQVEEGLSVLAEALAFVDKTGERVGEAELYRLKGELTLQQFQVSGSTYQVEDSLGSSVQSLESEAEGCFLKAVDIARRQQAKSLELRAVMSLSRLWQQQGKSAEAHQMLAEIYDWFTGGFDTKDLQEAKALLEELT